MEEFGIALPELEPLVAEAWLAGAVDADNPLLAGVLRDAFEHVDDTGLVVTHPSLASATELGEPTWGAHRVSLEPVRPGDVDALAQLAVEPAGLREELALARTRVVVSEELPGHLDPAPRLAALESVLAVLEAALTPLGWVFPQSGYARGDLEPTFALGYGEVSLRSQPSSAAPDGVLLDTLGMDALGLPDVECHVRGVPERLVEERVLALAAGILLGEFVADGDPVIVGRRDEDGYEYWFTARYGVTQRLPMRRAIVLVPEPAHAVDPPPEPYEAGVDDE